MSDTHPRSRAWDGYSQVPDVLIVEGCGRSRRECKAKLCVRDGSANTSSEVGLPECNALRVLVRREGLSERQGRTAQQRDDGLHDEREFGRVKSLLESLLPCVRWIGHASILLYRGT